jgi:hypothetical protein
LIPPASFRRAVANRRDGPPPVFVSRFRDARQSTKIARESRWRTSRMRRQWAAPGLYPSGCRTGSIIIRNHLSDMNIRFPQAMRNFRQMPFFKENENDDNQDQGRN